MDALLTDIEALVGSGNVLTGEDVSRRSVDWLSGAPCRARAIVRPASPQELAAVMRLCHSARQPVVAHGGLTGLVQGADVDPDELAISLERLTTIEHVDTIGATLTVQAGVPLQAVQEAAEAVGLQFALDLGARGSCTIGGNIATNAGGVRVIRYGMMRQQVLGLEAVLADGTVVSSMSRMLKNNAGFDLKQLFIGSEGTLGIVTRAVLRLHPATPDVQTALVACDSFAALTGLLARMGNALGGSLAAFEVMWQSHYRLLTTESGRHTPPIAPEAPFFVIVESLGHDPTHHAELFSASLEAALESELINDAVIAHSAAQRQGIWAIREDIEGLIAALSPLLAFDVSLPIHAMADYIDALEPALIHEWPGARLVTFGHLGDGNLHLSISVGSADPQTRQAVAQCVYTPLAALGGSVSAEHGIGLEKRDYLALSRTPEEIALMHTLKHALDPHHLLNRHKVLAANPG
ncbi:FAD-binding oxidoreductase [Halomonas sp. TRM85114]|uniref:FAD-binding oxidoreductase n=1 Tax=Halomonas jincaotanensis TaxID=2810616 RepID=UPI001BD5CA37|nr:FAD-binding oxidoreductase [Halomonas jincaotanensis]MBS9402444.1 FAD-binding oxidoreductase [Halomonas jincaotanensis]